MLPADPLSNLQRQMISPVQVRLAAAGRCGALLIMLLLSACASSLAQEHACTGRQIVIGFTPGVDAALPGTAASLSHDAGVTIVYMRHLFDRYSLYCAGLEEEPPVTEATLQRLRNRIDILSVEADRVRHPEGGN